MARFKYLFLIVFVFISSKEIIAGILGSNIDSLKNIIKTSEYDTLVCHAYASWGSNIYGTKPDSAILLWETAIELAKKNIPIEKNQLVKNRFIYSIAQCSNNLGVVAMQQGRMKDAEKYLFLAYKNNIAIDDKISVANVLNSLGYFYGNTGQIKKSINFHNRSLKLFKSVNDKDAVAAVLTNLAFRYDQIGQIEKSLKVNYEALKIKEEIGDHPKSIAYSINNIASIYNKQGDHKKALEFFNKSLEYRLKIADNADIADTYLNIGKIYNDRKQYKIALEYFSKSTKLYREVNNKSGLATSFLNIGGAYSFLNEDKKGLDYCFMALEIAQSIENKSIEGNILSSISRVYFKMNNYKEAANYAEEALKISKSLRVPKLIEESSSILSRIYEEEGNYKKAFEMRNLEIEMHDSLNNQNTQKAAAQQQAQYEYEKQKTIDDAAYDKQIALGQEKQKKQRVITISIGIGLGLVVIFLLFVFNRLHVTRKQKIVIEKQRDIVEEAHKEITDSINYAERIQRSFLATSDLLDQNLNEYFVFFQPKDVVSGDFYWAGKLANNQFAMVNADSTGHGVPGAIMSILNISSIEKAIDQKLIKPAEIFNHTRDTIIERLSKDGSKEGGKDGMDATIISFDFDNNKFSYTAAHNPIWIIRAGNLIEIKPEKMPIGKHENDNIPFVGGEFVTQKGDVIYTITDGFHDQFGGEKGKKFKVKPFKDYLISIAHLPMQEQKERLTDTFNSWKGDEEQVDDVCVIGVRV